MTNITSYRVAPTLYLTLFALNTAAFVAKVVDTPTDHVFVIDVSGSMYGELPAIREHLKTRLATVLHPGDRFSLITYSGRGQCTRVLSGVNLKDAASLSGIQRAIDNYVRPIGMTAFVDALDELAKLVGELRASRPNTAIAAIQMTDGQDNCYSRAQILAACDKLRGKIDSFDVVEYGMWTDRNLLAAMAERVGGSLTYVDGAEAFVTLTERVVQKRVSSAKLRTVDLGVGESALLAFSLGDNTINTYAINGGKVEVPDVPMTIAVLSLTSSIGVGSIDLDDFVKTRRQGTFTAPSRGEAHAYAAVALLAMRSQPKPMYAILRALGDVALVNKLSTCFGKQAYTEASSMAQSAAFDTAARWTNGFDQNAVPRDDAFTIVDLVELLVNEGAELDDANIKFARIGPKRVDASSVLTTEEAAVVKDKLEKAMETLDVDAFTEVRAKIDEVIASKGPTIKFVPTSDRAKIGSAAWNQKEANLSITVRRPGYVDLSAIPNSFFHEGLPHQTELARAGILDRFETSIVRTRPLVASGIRNMDKIVIFGNERVWAKLVAEGVIDNVTAYEERMEVNLRRVPPCNMKMRDALSALHLIGLHHRLIKVNALIKAFEDARDAYPRTDWIVEKYGTEAATWLDTIGVKRYGFNPQQRGGTKTGDVRESRQMIVKIAGLSSLPTVDAVKKRFAEIAAHEKAEKEALDAALAAGKKAPKPKKAPTLTPSMELVAAGIRANEAFLASAEYTSVTNKEGRDIVHTTWLDQRLEALEKEAETIRVDVAKATFTAIVGQGGFVEFADRELADTFELSAVKMPDGSVVDATIEFATKSIDL